MTDYTHRPLESLTSYFTSSNFDYKRATALLNEPIVNLLPDSKRKSSGYDHINKNPSLLLKSWAVRFRGHPAI